MKIPTLEEQPVRLAAIIAESHADAIMAMRAFKLQEPELYLTFDRFEGTAKMNALAGFRPELIIVTHQAHVQGIPDYPGFRRFSRGSLPKPVRLLNPDYSIGAMTDTAGITNGILS